MSRIGWYRRSELRPVGCRPSAFSSQFHRQYHHRHVSQMQPAQHGKRRFTVKLTNVPIIAFEDELAGKEDTVRKFTVDLLGEVRELFDRVRAEGEVRLGGDAVVVAIRDKVRQYLGRQPFDPLEILGSPIDVRIDGTDIHEYAVSKFTRKFSPHPLQRMNAAATARAHHK